MDNVTHTMIGACLGKAGLDQKTRLAWPALLLGANLPDIDGLATFGGENVTFAFRRGWTHGVPALVVLPIVFVGVLLLVDRWRRRRNPELETQPVNVPWLVALVYIATLTHPTFDWFNTYGMRWLAPIDMTWTYGDTLFIIDPWLWLALAAPLVLSAPRVRWWAVGGVVASALILFTSLVPVPARIGWLAGLGFIVALRRGWIRRPDPARAARAVVIGAAAYCLAMFAGSEWAGRRATHWFSEQGITVTEVMPGPVAANPLMRDVVGVAADRYHFVRVSLASFAAQNGQPPLVSASGPAVDAAVAAPQIAGFMSWVRYPAFTVDSLTDGYVVQIQDARYARSFGGGFGSAWVELDAELRPVEGGMGVR